MITYLLNNKYNVEYGNDIYPSGAIPVTIRPEKYSQFYTWNNTEWIIDLNELKQNCITKISNLSFTKRQEILPDYKVSNALLGLYDESTKTSYINLITAFRNEFYRLKTLIENSSTIEQIEDIMNNQINFP